ncbi:P1 family peptidase [Saccharothrix australiensis]|uniref:L-aminopeptidase/D-esterase-like protein n=1 Tax=Saccharothrix australiensis TaxID=2072 RepID=A0A495W3S0_9PSEU|nr:P1 family peptidase [Saccharothrix australiensis]RKT54458.1 L-aminopeptidase/D-esterase-like protein [Saccharothrix australiensis]
MKRSSTTGLALLIALGVTAPASADEPGRTGPDNAITDVAGVLVGHHTDRATITGTTALVMPKGSTAGADVRGGAPGTINTDLLDPVALRPEVHGLFLSGGSVMGLSAYAGVVHHLREQGLGSKFLGKAIPVVPGAIVFDLGQGVDADDPIERTPDFDAGYQAAKAARPGPVEMGSVGAGTGTGTDGPPGTRLKGGVGTASIRLDGGVVVGALVVLNSAGKVYNEALGCELHALHMEVGDEYGDTRRPPRGCRTSTAGSGPAPRGGGTDGAVDENTTIGVVATNATLTVAQAEKFAQVAHDGLARAIRPAHSMGDGDTTFGISTRTTGAPDDLGYEAILDAAASTFSRATVHAALAATPLGGRPTYCEVFAGACDTHRPAGDDVDPAPGSGGPGAAPAPPSGNSPVPTLPLAITAVVFWTLWRRRTADATRDRLR